MRPEEIVEFGEALSRIAATGGGPKALASHLANAARGGVLLEDARWHALATAGAGEIPASGREVVEIGCRRTSRARHGRRYVAGLALALRGTRRRRLAPAPNRCGDRRRTLAQRLDRARAKGRFLGIAARRRRSRRGRDSRRRRPRAASRWRRSISRSRWNATTRSALRALATQTLRASGGDLGLVERGALLLIFVPAARALDASNAKTAATLLPKSAARRAPNLRISGGVGTVEPPLRLRASAEAAEAALAIGRRIYGSGRVAIYEDLGAYRLLYEGANAEQLRVFAAETLAPLRAYDETHQTELERTLKIYFTSGQNVKTAAAELNVHRHTVFYRLRQIGEISERSLDSPHDQLTLRLAVAIDELYNAN